MIGKEEVRSRVFEVARQETSYVVSLLQQLVRTPSLSTGEEQIAGLVRSELENLKPEKVFVESMGSVVAQIGRGRRVVVYDAHLDTVGIGDKDSWLDDPFSGIVSNGRVYGRGACDDKGSVASMIAAVRILTMLSATLPFSLFVVFTVQEEDCEGLALESFPRSLGQEPDCVVIGEPSDLAVMRGHRGRAEIEVVTRGKACHGSMPHLGENAIYKMAPIVTSVEWLQSKFREDPFLGRGTAAVTAIECNSASRNTIPDVCRIYIDRRTVPGDTPESVVREIEEIGRTNRAEASLTIYEAASYTGQATRRQRFFPAWVTSEQDKSVQAACQTFEMLFGTYPVVSKWDFSTDGNYSKGVAGIPTVGFGPGDPKLAHMANETIPIDDLWKAAAFYAVFPFVYSSL
ncbi:MAG TPA: YgeY family selenium metabolism-linked hydrolase [Firmicutes bacterium]|nr:YgeY family selenium metabolism-linked hydrolase [Bacillota bacterium]